LYIIFLEHNLFLKFRFVSSIVLFENSDCVYARKRWVESFGKRDKDGKRRKSKEKICVWKRKKRKMEKKRKRVIEKKKKKKKRERGMARKIREG
jgi:hypothetical protein